MGSPYYKATDAFFDSTQKFKSFMKRYNRPSLCLTDLSLNVPMFRCFHYSFEIMKEGKRENLPKFIR